MAANCFVMVVRILYSSIVTTRFFRQRGLVISVFSALPRLPVIVSFIFAAFLTALSEQYLITSKESKESAHGLRAEMIHIAIGGAIFIFVAAVTVLFERHNLSDARKLIANRNKKDD